MATTVAAPAARKGFLGVALRIILWILLLVIVAGTLAFLWFYNGARSALPQLDGSISVAGLQAPVSVEDFWTLRCEMSETLRQKLATLSIERLTEVKREALEAFRQYSTEGGMSFPAEVLIVSGSKNDPT